MTFQEQRILADENIHPILVARLRERGLDVVSIHEAGLRGCADARILATAFAERRVVLTHDSDFGTLAIAGGAPFRGIVYLRPGHIDPASTWRTIEALMSASIDWEPPLLVVARNTGTSVRIRVRRP